MRKYYFLLIICIGLSCSMIHTNSYTIEEKNEIKKDKIQDTVTMNFLTYCITKQDYCLDSFKIFFSSNSGSGLERFPDEQESFIFNKKFDTITINPLSLNGNRKNIIHQFLTLLEILGNIDELKKHGEIFPKSFNNLDRLNVSSFFKIELNEPKTIMDTIRYGYSFAEKNDIKTDSTNLYVEINISKMQDDNLKFLMISHEIIKQNNTVNHVYKTVNDSCPEFVFSITFKTDNVFLMEREHLFDFHF